MRAKRNYEEPAKRGKKRGNTFPLAQFNPRAAREVGASEIETDQCGREAFSKWDDGDIA